MTQVKVDKERVDRMVTHTLMNFHDSGAHPGEVVIALAECIARVVLTVGELQQGSGIVQKELVELAIKHMANSIDINLPRIQ